MNAADRIRIKKTQNLERRNREDFLSKLDGELLSLLKGSDFIHSNEVPASFQNTYDNIQSDSTSFALTTLEFDDTQHLIEALPNSHKENGSSYLSIGYDFPIFKVEFNEIYALFPELISRISDFDRFFLITEKDSKIGIAISEYIGYLPKEQQTNNREVIYTLSYWGFN
jgi:hypothetical protein